MIKKGTKMYSVANNKCPRCHEGDFFVHSNSFQFKNNLKIYKKCSNCHLKYMLEPSFYYGAMYISYALTVAFAIAVFVISYLFGVSIIISFIAIIVSLVILMPVAMRLSRILYINMFVHFDEEI
jgi:uncharacterized protein (DUF983 family)